MRCGRSLWERYMQPSILTYVHFLSLCSLFVRFETLQKINNYLYGAVWFWTFSTLFWRRRKLQRNEWKFFFWQTNSTKLVEKTTNIKQNNVLMRFQKRWWRLKYALHNCTIHINGWRSFGRKMHIERGCNKLNNRHSFSIYFALLMALF